MNYRLKCSHYIEAVGKNEAAAALRTSNAFQSYAHAMCAALSYMEYKYYLNTPIPHVLHTIQ